MRRPTCIAALLIAGVLTAVRPLGGAAQPDPTFTRDVAPILYTKCVTCHRPGEVAPMALLTYQDVRPWARAIKERVTSRQMPPWFADPNVGSFLNDPRLSAAEVDTIARWVDAGAPQGDPKQMPKPPVFTDGWQLGEPDQIIELPEVQIPAAGGDIFPTPNIAIDLKEDRWVRAIEVRPSNREVTHHSVIFSTSGNPMTGAGLFDVLAVWAVGTPPTVYPDGTGRWVRKGQQLRTNLHYHPNGKPQVDRTRIGLYFGKGELKKEVGAALAGNVFFTIPPNAPNHELRATYVADQDIDVVSFFPHMHLRGKDMKMTATFPDGRQEVLLNVPAYDFNWQLFYYPKTKISLPRGTRLDLVAHYDNSAANRNNPDPNKAIRFGEASTAEMMFGMFEFTPKNTVSPRRSTDRERLEALTMTLPPKTTMLVDLPFAANPTPIVFDLRETGESRLFIPTLLGVSPVPLQELKWEGSSFQFQTALLNYGPGSGFYNVVGTVGADGAVSRRFTRRGPNQPPFYDFSGLIKK